LPVCGIFLPADDNRSKTVLLDFHGVYNCELLLFWFAVSRTKFYSKKSGWLVLYRTFDRFYVCCGCQTFIGVNQIHQASFHWQILKKFMFACEFQAHVDEGFEEVYK
jgi:hypothetical protein